MEIMKTLKRFISTVKYKWQGLFWINAMFSPFRRLTFSVYFGDIIHGTPYFLPRRWKKFTHEDCVRKAEEAQKRVPKHIPFTHKPEYYKGYSKPVPIKYFGINLTGFGWKTKWDSFRFEWSPSISIVIFGKQLFIVFFPKTEDGNDSLNQYWEAFLNYHYRTDRRFSKKMRLIELFEQHSCTWSRIDNGVKTEIDYYDIILKPKYVKFYHSIRS